MKLSNFNYHLPKELIAQVPMKPRDHSRLLVLDKKNGKLEHKYFYDLPDYLEKGDVLVLNNSRVFPARLIGKKKESGGKIEVFLLRHLTPRSPLQTSPPAPLLGKERGRSCTVWQCLVGGRIRREGQKIEFKKGLECEILKDNGDGTWEVKFNKTRNEMMKIVDKIGQMPLPPYIKRPRDCHGLRPRNDRANYQTVYADEKKTGSVAAPTAGFHFTPRLMKKLKTRGIQFKYITLHVGLGTFSPVKVNDISRHKMHAEWVEVEKSVINNIIKAKQEGRRIIAVGTTSVRALEAVFSQVSSVECRVSNITRHSPLATRNFSGWVDIFIYPGFKFRVVDAMITNFHLPKSTLLMLVSAFAGKANIDRAYKAAIRDKYRFYSYGDAMYIF